MHLKTCLGRHAKWQFVIVATLLTAILSVGIGLAQGTPNLVWMKGLGNPYFVSTSRDGAVQMRYVSGPDGDSIRMVRSSDRRQMYSIYGALSQYRVALSPNGQRIAYFLGADQLRVCRADTGALIWSKSMPAFDPNSLSFSSDSNYLGFSIGNDLTILRVSDGNLCCTLHSDANLNYEFSPAGPEVLVTSVNGSGYNWKFNFYSPADGHLLRGWSLTGGPSQGFSFRGYSADGSLIALKTGNAGTGTALYKALDGTLVGGLVGINSPWGYHFENWAGGKLFAFLEDFSTPSQRGIDSWDLGSKSRTRLIDMGAGTPWNEVRSLAVPSLSSEILIAGNSKYGQAGGLLEYFDRITGAFLRDDDGHGVSIDSISYSPDGQKILSSSVDDIHVWDAATGQILLNQKFPGENRRIYSVAYSPLGDSIVVCSSVAGKNSQTRLISPIDGHVIRTMEEPAGVGSYQAVFSPDGTYVVGSDSDGFCRVWLASTGSLISSAQVNAFAPLAMSPNGDSVVIGTSASTRQPNLTLLSIPNLQILDVLDSTPAANLSFSRDGTKLAVGYLYGGRGEGVKLLNISSAHKFSLSWIQGAIQSVSEPVAIDGNARFVAHASWEQGKARINFRSLTTGTTVAKYYDQEAGGIGQYNTNAIAYSPDNRFFAFGGYNCTLAVAQNPYWRAPVLSSLSTNLGSIRGGNSLTGSVTLDGPAIGGGGSVALTSSNPSVVVVPTSASVPYGAITTSFPITTTPVTSTAQVTITATYGGVTKTRTITLTPITVVSLTIAPTSVRGGSSATGTVTLTAAPPVGSGGLAVTLSSNSLVAVVPPSVTVSEGSVSATFPITTSSVSTNTTVTVGGSANLTTRNASVIVTPPLVSALVIAPNPLAGGNAATGTITLDRPTSGSPVTVTLSSTSPAASVPGSVSVPVGANSVTFPISTSAVAANTTIVISTKIGTAIKSAYLYINATSLQSLTLAPNPVTGGATVTGTITMSGPVFADTVVALSNTNARASLSSSTVTIPAGSSTATFTLTTSATTNMVTGTVRAVIGSSSKSVSLTVKP